MTKSALTPKGPWNMVMVLDANAANATLRKYAWGLDLSGTMHGAGGIGGLLACVETSGTNDGSYWYLYDGNGNVGQVVSALNQTVVARHEYDPYGNTVVQEGNYAAANPIRFSTKWFDDETRLGYWGYRYYNFKLGRWLSRDPIGESGGWNLYMYVMNIPLMTVDVLGKCWKDYIPITGNRHTCNEFMLMLKPFEEACQTELNFTDCNISAFTDKYKNCKTKSDMVGGINAAFQCCIRTRAEDAGHYPYHYWYDKDWFDYGWESCVTAGVDAVMKPLMGVTRSQCCKLVTGAIK